ncbi:related to ATP synthase subunit e, mitochondrial [Zygosaccharomyces bailii ISA1307]|nr:related to ATP synthase subunit e, mitochondrial [Zygosaccharomyces bailii ISA1307]
MSTVNVLRYSALGLGLFYGFKNDMGLRSAAAQNAAEEAFQKKYGKLQGSANQKGVKDINLEDPNLDFGAVILQAVDSLSS